MADFIVVQTVFSICLLFLYLIIPGTVSVRIRIIYIGLIAELIMSIATITLALINTFGGY
jgi:hypothetical protein